MVRKPKQVNRYEQELTSYRCFVVRKKNADYDKVIKVANSTKGGDYLQQRKLLGDIGDDIRKQFDLFYTNVHANPAKVAWDVKLGAKPPYGTFDSTYYKKQNPNVAAKWTEAVNLGDLDVINRYNESSYYLQHYTTTGKAAGLRGNAPEATSAATAIRR